jgi:hypothetical protein
MTKMWGAARLHECVSFLSHENSGFPQEKSGACDG